MAESLGLSGANLTDFMYRQQELHRGERAAEREMEKVRLEAAAAENVARVEAAAAESAARAEAAERELARAHEIRLLELRPSAINDASLSDVALRPKLPTYRDGDDITSYLIRFERIAALLQLKRESYAIRLGSLLTGKAVKIYAALAPEITENYDSLKLALLSGFNKTHETYRSDFRSARIGVDETYQQFAVQLGRQFDFWLDSLSVQKTYENLREFMIVDQFLSSLPTALRVFIKEQNCHSLDEVVKLADNWALAHRAYPADLKSNGQRDYKPIHRSESLDGPSRTPRLVSTADGKPEPPRKCYACGDGGHVKKDCPQNPKSYFKGQSPSRTVQFCLDDTTPRKYLCSGTVNNTPVSMICRDSGSSCIIVSDKVIPRPTGAPRKTFTVKDYLGREDKFPVVRCFINCPYFRGWANAIRAPIKFCSVLIGNVKGATDLTVSGAASNVKLERREPPASVQAVTTRSAAVKRRSIHPMMLPNYDPGIINTDQLRKRNVFFWRKERFFWPSVTTDIRNYCQTCEVCQLFSPRGSFSRVPLQPPWRSHHAWWRRRKLCVSDA
jgi:hypothetical protein